MWRGVKAALLAALLLAPVPAGAAAGASPWAETPEARARLLAAETAVGEGEAVTLGLEIVLAPGWKTYWRSPGESGGPPRLDWSGSTNLARTEITWPAPERFLEFDLQSHGYKGRVILPIRAFPTTPGAAMTARLKLDYQVCKEICIPVSAALSLALPKGPAARSPQAGEIAGFQARVPRANGEGGITIAAPRLVHDDRGRALTVAVAAPVVDAAALLIVESKTRLDLGRAERVGAGKAGEARFRVSIGRRTTDAELAGHELTLTYIDGREAREARLAVAP